MKLMAKSTAAAGLVTVVTPTEIHRSGWSRGPLTTPAGALSDLGWLLTTQAYAMGAYGPGRTEATLVVSALNLPAPVEVEVGKWGWKTTPTEGGWYTLIGPKPHGLTVHLGIINRGALNDLGLTDAAPDHIANTLAWWWMNTGAHYRHTPGVAAVASMRAHPRRIEPRWILKNPATTEAWQSPANITELHVNRKAPKVGHQFDMRSAYLAAAAAVELPYTQLRHTGTDPATLLCGYYRIAAPAWPARQPWPKALWPDPDRQGCFWLTAPEYELWRRLGHPHYELVDSWTPRHDEKTGHGRILRSWAEDWRDTINNHRGEPMERPLKLGYAFAIGLMNVPKGTIYRPDWRHFIIGHVRASIVRRVHTVHAATQQWPTKIDVDSLYYPPKMSADLLATHLGVGGEIGRMRYEGKKT